MQSDEFRQHVPQTTNTAPTPIPNYKLLVGHPTMDITHIHVMNGWNYMKLPITFPVTQTRGHRDAD